MTTTTEEKEEEVCSRRHDRYEDCNDSGPALRHQHYLLYCRHQRLTPGTYASPAGCLPPPLGQLQWACRTAPAPGSRHLQCLRSPFTGPAQLAGTTTLAERGNFWNTQWNQTERLAWLWLCGKAAVTDMSTQDHLTMVRVILLGRSTTH